MSKFQLGSSVKVSSMGIRVKDRDKMIDFYRNIIGFSLIREENALAIMGSVDSSVERFYLEESPRADAYFGNTKKLNHFVLQVTSIDEINALFGRLQKANYQKFKRIVKEKEICLEITDPEENKLTVIFTKDEATDKVVDQEKIDINTIDESIRLNESFYISALQVNALNLKQQSDFLTQILGFKMNHPLTVTVVETEDEVAAKASHEVVGLEFLRLELSENDFNKLEAHLVNEKQEFFVDKKKRILTVEDPAGIEWWFDRV